MDALTHVWDLNSLFNDDNSTFTFTSDLKKRASAFEANYKGKLCDLSSDTFNLAIKEYEALWEDVGRVMTYAGLSLAADSNKGAFYAKCELSANEVQEHLVFFTIEFCDLPQDVAQKFISACPKYAYYLKLTLDNKKYQLSLKEEKILISLSPLGASAFARLFDEFYSNLHVDFDGKSLSLEEILSLQHNKDRHIRSSAQEAFTKALRDNRLFLTYILNMIRKDLSIHTNLRGYENKEISRHISNQTTQKSVDSLINAVNGAMDLSIRYYKTKAKILGIELKDYDRYAPIAKTSAFYSYKDGLNIVLEALNEFSPIFHKIANDAAQNGWIDSHPRDRKRGGAFSHGSVPSSHPFVMLNHTDNRRDVFTIAHEFGHMIHQELSKKQGYLNMDTPLTTAETASVFSEMILFEKMKKSLSKQELKELYASKLEDIIATLFRQIVMTNFERRIHDLEGELSADDFDNIWLEENERQFKGALELTPNYGAWWSYIPHFIHTPFYCYAYSYGQLLVLALFGLYKRSNKEEFIQTYIKFLESGGSKSPKEMVQAFGFDIESDDFWQIGLAEVRALIEEFEALL
ncbi:MAG: M3 family oligoendopeptidase [Helicobacter sp.]|nr:M3 family oligoendopeptidase [Helicobacter sp.]